MFFAPILIPRAISYYRSFRTSIKQRPPPRPLPDLPRRAINILFFTCFFFLLLSLPYNTLNPHAPEPNIFALTSSRLTTSTQLVFSRLARLREGGELTARDELLREALGTTGGRKLYLRFGAETVLGCVFCGGENPGSYLLYYLPFHTLLPHFFHLLVVGVVTAAPLVGEQTSRWRNKFVLVALGLAMLDLYAVAAIDPTAGLRGKNTVPWSLYNDIEMARPLVFALVDAVFAGLVYVSETNRFFYVPPSAAEQAGQAAEQAGKTLGNVLAKVRTVGVVRQAVVRDRGLKARDDGYWRVMGGVGM